RAARAGCASSWTTTPQPWPFRRELRRCVTAVRASERASGALQVPAVEREQPVGGGVPQPENGGEKRTARDGQGPAGRAIVANDQELGDEDAVDEGSQGRVDHHAGAEGVIAQIEEAVERDRQREQDGNPPRPAVDDLIEARGARNAEQ